MALRDVIVVSSLFFGIFAVGYIVMKSFDDSDDNYDEYYGP
jgi:hypothetical protein